MIARNVNSTMSAETGLLTSTASKSLPKCMKSDENLFLEAELTYDSFSFLSVEASCMCLVHDKIAILPWKHPFNKIRNLSQWCEITVHTVDALNSNEDIGHIVFRSS